ncbi:hypothetical protein NKJ55_29065 [Mesorhizobium sp. M0106]|uniref:hypothetical protein n=1 Tax=Mesorhizobium sp. M0106 TaxID=2956880 RepID=UPI0033365911
MGLISAGHSIGAAAGYRPFQDPTGTWTVNDARAGRPAEMGSRTIVGMNQHDPEELADLLNGLNAQRQSVSADGISEESLGEPPLRWDVVSRLVRECNLEHRNVMALAAIGSPCLERSALLQNRVSKLQNRATRYNETTGTGTSLCI